MAQTSDVVTEEIGGVVFSFMTDEDIQKHSLVRITSDRLVDTVNQPVPGGLYDPALGPLDERTPCKSCGQGAFNCPGHCGHIDLLVPVYNPLLFHTLYTLLREVCFFCHHFKANRSQVKKCVSQLELIIKGDIIGAKRLDSSSLDEYPEDSSGSHESSSTVHSGAQCTDDDALKQQEWTSMQFTEAKFVLNTFLNLKIKKCENCNAKSPTISKPFFGWFQKGGVSDALAAANVLRGFSVKGAITGGDGATTELDDGTDASGVFSVNSGDEAETHSSHGTPDSGKGKHRRKGREVLTAFIEQKNFFKGSLLPSEVKNILKLLWENEAQLCSFIGDIQQKGFGKQVGPSMFFLEKILVPPIKFRPLARAGDSVMEHPHTNLLVKVLKSNILLGNAIANSVDKSMERRWMELQQSVNILFDSKKAGQGQRDVPSGICQLLEKKEGMFRQKMMGKRVNYACRSVISPDPYLAVNEIGIPPYFALRLTYPERVTPWNVGKLRDAVINGSEIHPGATHYVDKLSTVKLPASRKMRISISRKLPSSRGAVLEPGNGCDHEFERKLVYRHLQDGDVVLVNRQPTLHKPSIMAHVVRVLKGEKTIRMHYANCSTYNADFDGDEMNVHFPQDEVSRAEAYNIVNANDQYIRPSSGDPIRSLIQDHIISAVLLTKRDTFLSRDEFNQLLYSSGVGTGGSVSFAGKPGNKVLISSFENEMESLLPTIWKPEPLWTGKQVISAVLNHITRGRPPFTVEKGGKISHDFFKSRSNEEKLNTEKDVDLKKLSGKKDNGEDYLSKEKIVGGDKMHKGKKDDKEPDEDKLLIYKNELVRGVIDKAQFADYGLVHTVHELYGSSTAGLLLSALSRLFTVFLQMHGFTCGVNDLLIIKAKDEERKSQLESCEEIGEKVHREFIKVPENVVIDPLDLQFDIEKTIRRDGEPAMTFLDRKMTSGLNAKTSSGALSELLSEGLLRPSGKNCISLMTTSGAKGSKVNFQQISSHLGQQELEGKRVPRMVSGKTLPCFHSWDWTSRAGGFITDRFLSGLRPQEYYFHCMAGREGLVDTAVKTSRSGYLQRCLIKNLECLKVGYDHTVRDVDGSIVQFQYGEDGVDVHRTSFIGKFEALAANQELLYKKCGQQKDNGSLDIQLDPSNNYITKLPVALQEKAEKFMGGLSLNERVSSNLVKQDDLIKLLKLKFLLSLAQPGEPVGVLAAQSVGEPSTQMTLNTFHLAGRGEMNVTLGIPRLQEIFMTASAQIKTPVMTCPLQEGKTENDANRLADKLKKITVADIIENMEVSVLPSAVENNQICRIYKLKMKLYKSEHYPKNTDITVEDWEETLEVVFVRELEDAIENHLSLLSKISGIKIFGQAKASGAKDEDGSVNEARHGENDDNDDDGDEDDAGGEAEDLGSYAQRQKLQASDEMNYDDGSEEEGETDQDDVELSSRSEGETNCVENETEISKDKEMSTHDDEGEMIESQILRRSTKHESKLKKKHESKDKTKSRTKRKKSRAALVKKETDRAIFIEASGFHFEVHFQFTNEPHLLLAQIAERTAERVYIQRYGKIDKCRVTNCKENQVIYYGKNPKRRNDVSSEEKEKIPALHTTGVDFKALWQMQDHLDVRYLYSNSIHAMLNTYGVEAARETIIREVMHVFGSYGISVNIRHLTLIADYMTHSGGYRPMNRHGAIKDSISPFIKMSFETASKFFVEAAYLGERDNLDTPSARICLGLPVKLGTGSFELMQKVEI
ncbi:DNA-directed RNA polymerase I subunit rpa1 [Tripterygium wilfordii]|uniref:DNA-directed RNA polymerase subunit n=1 Tax=Tripterygium wilfordii TaxID=458696 RepID=A0A7J7BY57_TRIWF|nr:DNA-directed RNA polymerase I subunit 1 [Tripterygium wilfordii]KAF5726829.1 DNA-directed RNA polymerase I subunit rpa1 [Tripterygium wilfordii]